MVNDGRIVITFTPGPYVFFIPKSRLWGPKKNAPAPRYDWLIEIDDFSIPSRSRPGPALKIDDFLKDFN